MDNHGVSKAASGNRRGLTMRNRGRAMFTVLCVVSLLAPVGTDAKRPPKRLRLADCYQQAAVFPIPREQAQSYLPKGFEADGNPASQESLINFYVSSLVCGDPESPTLELFTTHVGVIPPKRYRVRQGIDRYVIDAGAEGAAVRRVQSHLCLGNLLEQASIDASQQMVLRSQGLAAGAPLTTISSDSISVRFALTAGGTSSLRTGQERWFYGRGGPREFFDATSSLRLFSLGSSTIAFDEPYRDLPQAAAGFSLHNFADVVELERSPACTRLHK